MSVEGHWDEMRGSRHARHETIISVELLVAPFGERKSPRTSPDRKNLAPKRIYRSMTAPSTEKPTQEH